MPRLNVIVLEKVDAGHYRYAMWADVPLARQSFYANPSAKSAWAGATVADNTALQTGAVVEQVDVVSVAAGATLAQVQAAMQATWTAYQAQVTAANPWVRYGSTWDGTSWVLASTA